MTEQQNPLSSMNRKDLADAIFRDTGMKVAADDPVVVAALIQSHLFRREGSDVVEAINEAVKDLTNTLPSQAKEIEARLSGLISQLNKAGESYQDRIHEFVNAEANMAKERMVGEVESGIKAIVLREIEVPMAEIKKANRASIWRTLGVAMVGGGVGCVLCLVAALKFF